MHDSWQIHESAILIKILQKEYYKKTTTKE